MRPQSQAPEWPARQTGGLSPLLLCPPGGGCRTPPPLLHVPVWPRGGGSCSAGRSSSSTAGSCPGSACGKVAGGPWQSPAASAAASSGPERGRRRRSPYCGAGRREEEKGGTAALRTAYEPAASERSAMMRAGEAEGWIPLPARRWWGRKSVRARPRRANGRSDALDSRRARVGKGPASQGPVRTCVSSRHVSVEPGRRNAPEPATVLHLLRQCGF